MQIDTKKQYIYTSSTIRPLHIQEYFPLKITQNKSTLGCIKFAPPANNKK